MTETAKLSKPEFNQEIRLGLVVYGGVSLAIYMNGVCQEFFNAVRGRGIYKLIKALTDSDIVVDIISGTSAGGVNGVLLSHSLTNSNDVHADNGEPKVVEFRNFARVWRDSGSISDLLRKPGANRVDADSLLDGAYYQQELVNALKQAVPETAPASDWYSPFPELDLFVTGTDVLGKVYQTFDNTGQVIEIKDHRTVFQLSYRHKRKRPFQPGNADALAKLCRITSCFPVAFPVVTVDLIKSDKTDADACESTDACLTRWGNLGDRASLPDSSQKQLHFVDGGVLDNRPFSYTIQQIYYRTASRPVDRKLFYIDPVPDSFLTTETFRKMERPTIWQSALDSLINLPRYESIAGDLEAIKEHNERVRRYKFLRSTAEREAEKREESAQCSSDGDREAKIYLRCRLVGLRDRLLPRLLKLDRVYNPYLLSQKDNADAALDKAAQFFTQYIADEDKQVKREEFLHSIGKEVRNLDIEYALRKHFYFLEKVFAQMEPDNDQRQKLKLLAEKVSHQIEILEVIQSRIDGLLSSTVIHQNFTLLLNREQNPHQYEDLIQAINQGANGGDCEGEPSSDSLKTKKLQKEVELTENPQKAVFRYLLSLHRFLLNLDPDKYELVPAEQQETLISITKQESAAQPQRFNIDECKQCLDERIQLFDDSQAFAQAQSKLLRILKTREYSQYTGPENYSDCYRSVLREIERDTEALITHSDLPQTLCDKLLSTFRNFRNVDQAIYSYEYLSDLHEKNLIEIIRVSPNAAKLGLGAGKSQDDKLAGDQFRAFGGFFKKSWRSNDILWGRLDGLNRIAEALITPESVKRFPHFVQREARQAGIAPDAYLDALIGDALPEAKSDEVQCIREVLGAIANKHPSDPNAVTPLLEKLLEAIVMAGHRAILKQDLPNVLEDALLEQIEWNQQSINADLHPLVYQTRIPKSRVEKDNSQLEALRQVDCFLNQVVSPRKRSKIYPLLQAVAKSYDSTAIAPNQINEKGIEAWLQTAYPKAYPSDRQLLVESLLKFATTIQNTQGSTEWLYRLLVQLHRTGESEVKQRSPTNTTQIDIINTALQDMNKQLKNMVESLGKKPAYGPVAGVFDKAVTPFAMQALAKDSINELKTQGLETYFTRDYRVANEDLSRDVPSYILDDITARAGVIFRDILGSKPTGDTLKRNPLYQFANYGLQLYYQYLKSSNPAVYRPTFWSRLTHQILTLLPFLVIGFIVVYFLKDLPQIVLLIILAIIPTIGAYYVWLRVSSGFRRRR